MSLLDTNYSLFNSSGNWDGSNFRFLNGIEFNYLWIYFASSKALLLSYNSYISLSSLMILCFWIVNDSDLSIGS